MKTKTLSSKQNKNKQQNQLGMTSIIVSHDRTNNINGLILDCVPLEKLVTMNITTKTTTTASSNNKTNKIDLSGCWSLLVNDETCRKLGRVNLELIRSSVIRRVNQDYQLAHLFCDGVDHGSACHGSKKEVTARGRISEVDLMNQMMQDFRVSRASLKNSFCKSINDELILWRCEVKRLGLLDINLKGSHKLTDVGLQHLAINCRQLKSLDIENSYMVTSKGLEVLCEYCTSLEALNLSGCFGIEGDGFGLIGKYCPSLVDLKISGCRNISSSSMFQIFCHCKALEVLDLSYCCKTVTDLEMKVISDNCPSILDLNLRECHQVSDAGVLHLSHGCQKLKRLDVSRTALLFKVTDVGLLALGERSFELELLNANGCEMISDMGLSWLTKGCKKLVSINLNGCSKVTNGGLRSLGENCPSLKKVSIDQLKRVTDVGIRFLSSGCSNLESLSLSSLYLISDGIKREFAFEGLQALVRANCSKTLKNLNLNGCFRVSSEALKAISHLTNLESLVLSSCTNLTFAGMSQISKGCKKLKSLNLSQCGDCVTDKMVEILALNMPLLSNVNLSSCEKVGRRAIGALARTCGYLKVLELSHCLAIDDDALVPLSECTFYPGLASIFLVGCNRVTSTGVIWLLDSLRNDLDELTLTTLSLRGTKATFESLVAKKDQLKYSQIRKNDSFFGLWPLPRATDRMSLNRYGRTAKAAMVLKAFYQICAAKNQATRLRKKRRRIDTAIFIQSLWRGYNDRKCTSRLLELKFWRNATAVKIQCFYRQFSARKAARALRVERWVCRAPTAVKIIQKNYRGVLGRRKAKKRELEVRKLRVKRNKNATKIQQISRMSLERRQYLKVLLDRKLLQSKREDSCHKIQQSYRSFSARKKLTKLSALHKKILIRREEGAKVIQKAFRNYSYKIQIQKRVTNSKNRLISVICIQSGMRMKLQRKRTRILLELHRQQKRLTCAVLIQKSWRRKACFIIRNTLQSETKALLERKAENSVLIRRWWRGCLGRARAVKRKEEYLKEIRHIFELEHWASTVISSTWRGKKGREKKFEIESSRKTRWKEMWSDADGKPFYYDQLSGEIRWSKPQQLLNLEPRPVCSNCEYYDARVECSDCQEFFCSQCWDAVHYGGKRAKHYFRSLYDYYGNRVNYEYKNNFPCTWPSEAAYSST